MTAAKLSCGDHAWALPLAIRKAHGPLRGLNTRRASKCLAMLDPKPRIRPKGTSFKPALAAGTHAPKAPAAGTVAMPPHTPNGTHSPGLLTRRKRQPQARWHGFPTPRTVHTRRGRSRADKAFALSSPLPVWNALPRCARTPKDAARRSHIYDACGAGMPSRQTLYGTLWRCPIALSASHKKGSVRCLGSLFAACQRYRIRVLYSPSPVC